MNLRTFTAESMPAALALVKQSLGADAVILHTRNYKRGGLFGFGAKMVVEITASPGDQVPNRRRRDGNGGRGSARSGSRNAGRGAERSAGLAASGLQQPLRRAGQGGAGVGAGASGRDRYESSNEYAGAASQQRAGDLIRRTYLAAQAEQMIQSGQGDQARRVGQNSQLPQDVRGGKDTVGGQSQFSDEFSGSRRAAKPRGLIGATGRQHGDDFAGRSVDNGRADLAGRVSSSGSAAASDAMQTTSGNSDVIARISDANHEASQLATVASNQENARAADDLAEELRAVKRMVAKMVRQQREGKPGAGRRKSAQCDLPDKLFDQYLGLLQQEVSEELAEEIIQQVRASVDPSQLDDGEVVRKAVQQAVTQLIPAGDNGVSSEKPEDGRPRTVALIGPTGVGKTTTIAKLAANFKLRDKKKVGLITIDTFRIAAVDQLKTYASIIGVPLQVISKPEQMADALKQFSDCDVVLIDTAGRSQRDDPNLDQLNSFVQAADPHEVHLVLSSTCTQSAIIDIVERFSAIRVDQIIFTKLDEAVTFGVLLNVSRKVKKRLSYITTGQEVPHQIEVSSSDRVAALVLGEAV